MSIRDFLIAAELPDPPEPGEIPAGYDDDEWTHCDQCGRLLSLEEEYRYGLCGEHARTFVYVPPAAADDPAF